MSEIHSEDRDFDRVASPALLAELEAAARYTKPITLDCSAAADVWGTITKLKSQLEDFKEAAERICFFDWSDNDPDAVRAIGALRILIHGIAK